MRSIKLKRDLNTKHPDHTNEDISFFKRHEKLQENGEVMNRYVTIASKAEMASFEASHSITKVTKLYNIGEILVLPVATNFCEILHGEKISRKPENLSK